MRMFPKAKRFLAIHFLSNVGREPTLVMFGEIVREGGYEVERSRGEGNISNELRRSWAKDIHSFTAGGQR